MVTSAGNSFDNQTLDPMSPSSCDYVISVSAIDPGNQFGCWVNADLQLTLRSRRGNYNN